MSGSFSLGWGVNKQHMGWNLILTAADRDEKIN